MKGLLLIACLMGTVANADIGAIPPNSKAGKVANTAASIFSVDNFKIGEMAYKVVKMDSSLNGDTSATTILMVGENGVGGEAGYDAAFQITPAHKGEDSAFISMEKVSVYDGKILFDLVDLDGNHYGKAYVYDAKTKTLVESGI